MAIKYSRVKQIIKEEVQKVVEEKTEEVNNFNALRDLYIFLKQSLRTEGMHKLLYNRHQNILEIKNPDINSVNMKENYTLKIEVKGDKFSVTAGSLFEGIDNKTETFGLRDFNKVLRFCQYQLNADL